MQKPLRTAEVPGELVGIACAALGRVAAADDRQRGQMQDLRITVYIKCVRRTGDLLQQLRPGVVRWRNPVMRGIR